MQIQNNTFYHTIEQNRFVFEKNIEFIMEPII